MSQLMAPTHTVVDQIPLGHRITDIMQEKGPAYTISAMAKRLDISRETLRLMLKGEREIYTYELQRIAQDLKLPVERILQTDVLEMRQRIERMIAEFKDLDVASELSDSFLQTALGSIEKSYASHWKGLYFYARRDYLNAHEAWLEAWSGAWSVLKKYGESGLLLRISANLSLTYSIRHDKKGLLQLVEQVQGHFEEHPVYSGNICYSLGRMHQNEGDLDLTLEQFYRGLSYMEKSQQSHRIFKARLNVGRTEYRIGNYRKALEMYENAFDLLESNQDPTVQSGFYLSYSMCLIQLHEFEKARHLLVVAEEKIKNIKVKNHYASKLEQELLLVLSIFHNDPAYAEQVANREDYEINYRKLACKFLTDTYERVGDFERKEMYRNLLRHRHTVIDLALNEEVQDPFFLLSLLELCVLIKWYED